MKGREIIDYAVRAKMPDREKIRENCLRQAVSEKEKTKRPLLRRSAFTIATATVLVICIMLGNMLMTPQGRNLFILQAYAMERQTDGSIELREVELLEQTQVWSCYRDRDENKLYVSISLKCEGENIKSVDFYSDNGFFAKQYLEIKNGKVNIKSGIPVTYIGHDGGNVIDFSDEKYIVVMYGEDFEIVGGKLTLDKGEMTDDLLLFLGIENVDWQQIPSQMTIRAVATFNDGKTQEETLTIDLISAMDVGTIKIVAYEMEEHLKKVAMNQETLRKIPLDKCEVIKSTVKTLAYGDTFEYQHGSDKFPTTYYYQITEDAINSAVTQGLFDENGIYRQGSNLPEDGNDGFIAVIINNGDGTFTGMVYNIPGQLILDNMK